jgi:hypothetical protein
MAHRTRKYKKMNVRTRKYRRNKKNSKSRKISGGRNIGANSCDPNYSIYNTNFLKLFPYKA